jgi:CelD/BcsL family acetyltransferase involved in cellulose biosynthesis
MIVRVVPASSLAPPELARWSEIQGASPALASPYFCPQFTSIVATQRPDSQVGILEDGGAIVGFFPFQRGRLGMGHPIGSILSDYHGVVAADDVSFDARGLLRGCGLKTWDFHHLLASQTAFASSHRELRRSSIINLSGGFEAYAQGKRQAGGSTLATLGRKTRKLEREHGEIRFVAHTADTDALEILMRWKSEQYARTGAVDILAQGWIAEVLRQVQATQSDGFAGMLSVLYVAEKPAAVHLGMRSSSVWHYWFPAYDASLYRYSPGLILLARMAEHAPTIGVTALDLGASEAEYKTNLMNDGVALAAGIVETPSLAAAGARADAALRSVVRASNLAPKARRLVRAVLPGSG